MRTIQRLSGIAVGAMIVLWLAFPAEAQTSRQVRFPKGSNTAIVTGKIAGGEVVIYLVNARKGQTLSFVIAENAANNDVVGEVFAPGGESLTGEDYGKQWRGKLPRDGVYQIRVGTIESENADFKMRITVR